MGTVFMKKREKSNVIVAVLYIIMGRKNVQVFRELDKISQLSRQERSILMPCSSSYPY